MSDAPSPIPEHHFERRRHLSALALSVFWAVGVAMIDPRTDLGVILCLVTIIATISLYSEDFRSMSLSHISSWPKIAICILIIEIFVPGYLLVSKGQEVSTPGTTNNGNSTNQSGGQTGGTINNNQQNRTDSGPTFNGNCNANGSGNSLCNNFYGPQRLAYSDILVGAIEKSLQSKNLDVEVGGGPEDIAVAHKILDKLKENGFHITSYGQANELMFMPKPSKKITIHNLHNKSILLIIPSL